MNADKYDDLSFKLLSLTILAGVFVALIDPAKKSVIAKPDVAPAIHSTVTTTIASTATDSNSADATAASATISKHRGHRRSVEKS